MPSTNCAGKADYDDRSKNEKTNGANGYVIFRRFRRHKNGEVMDAHEFGHAAWPIRIRKPNAKKVAPKKTKSKKRHTKKTGGKKTSPKTPNANKGRGKMK